MSKVKKGSVMSEENTDVLDVDDISQKSCYDDNMRFLDNVYLSLWENQNYLPDPIADAFRKAVVKTAIEICHECGTVEASVNFCSRTIAEWMEHDIPKEIKNGN